MKIKTSKSNINSSSNINNVKAHNQSHLKNSSVPTDRYFNEFNPGGTIVARPPKSNNVCICLNQKVSI